MTRAYKSLGHAQAWSFLLMLPGRKQSKLLSSGFEDLGWYFVTLKIIIDFMHTL